MPIPDTTIRDDRERPTPRDPGPRRPREREIGVPGLLVLIADRQGLPAPPDSWCYCAVDRLA